MKPTLKLLFTDFWGGFHPSGNIFVQFLRKNFEIEISDQPDILFYSVYDFNHLKYRCPKIFFTAENVRPNFHECDRSLTFDFNTFHGKNFRLPYYRTRYGSRLLELCKPLDVEAVFKSKTKFCCTVVSNGKGKERNQFYELLSQYKKVDSGGRYLNNVGGPVENKMDFIKDYKFVLAFENTSYPGYTTEKIVEPMLVNSVPVYWGSPRIGRDFNRNSIVNLNDFSSFQEAVDAIIELDSNDDLYKEKIKEPFFKDNLFPSELTQDYIEEELAGMVTDILNSKCVSKKPYFFLTSRANRYKKKILSRVMGRPHFYF